jgi:hypothetical protein
MKVYGGGVVKLHALFIASLVERAIRFTLRTAILPDCNGLPQSRQECRDSVLKYTTTKSLLTHSSSHVSRRNKPQVNETAALNYLRIHQTRLEG